MKKSMRGLLPGAGPGTLMLAILWTCLPAAAGEVPDPNVLLSRTFIDVTPGADFESGNYEHRRDRFTNTSSQQLLVLAGIEVLMLNPEDLGFADLEPANVTAVVAAARSAYPDYRFWGTSFWNYAGGIPPLDVPPVEWVFSEFPGTTFPVELEPGASFVLETRTHNSLLGPANPPPERIGELIIGWKFVTARCGNGVVEDAEDCDDGNPVDDDGCRNDCTEPVCGDGIVDTINREACDDGNQIDADDCRNNCTIPICGDFIVDPQNGETCDPPEAPAGVHGSGCRADCTVCGDGVVDSGEDCDDGNTTDDDGCRNDCTAPVCGDGIPDPGEDCDDGNLVDDDGCRNDCTAPICGDGIVDEINEESCDDGNLIDDDGCRNDCTIPFCGDFIVDAQNAETCDPPGAPFGVHEADCREDCTVCGDAVTDASEDCDDGNTTDDDGCRNDCTAPVCGDGIPDPGEDCDDGNLVDDDGCRNDCTAPICGDGIVDEINEESCDDGNLIDDDGCRNDCTIPFCGDFIVDAQNAETCDPPGAPFGVHEADCREDCTVCGDAVTDASEDCDDGNTTDDDGCRNDCTAPVCGDGIPDPGEDCDDGNLVDDDGCRNDCTAPICGDGIVDEINEESCDDGNLIDDDGCRNDCTIPFCGDFIVDAQNAETCDPPGAPSGAIGNDCRIDCTVCGDGVVDPTEECDDGNASDTDACRNDCTERGIITRNADGANSVVVSDVDGDGDYDVVSASGNDDKIAWHENTDTTGDGFGDGVVWVEHLVSDQAKDARFVTAGPLGLYAKFGDHLVAATFLDNSITAYENIYGDGVTWFERIISSAVNGASSVHLADLNEDSCNDVLATGATDGTVVWFADLMCDGLSWSPPNVIDAGLPGARAAVAAPLNLDQALDVLAVGFDANSVVAYLNGGGGTAFSPVVISNTAFGATSIQTADFDFDGDFDAVVATSGDDSITWYENVNVAKQSGDGTTWAPHVVSSSAGGASAVFAIDLDFDEDMDIVAAAADDGTITWYENAAGDGSLWTPHTLGTSSPGASSVTANDLNGDFQTDVVAASFDNDTVAWFENVGGLFPGQCGNGELNAFETCDPPGAAAGGNGNLCRADCTVCGDALIDPGEDCDDGNGVDVGDQCNNSCTAAPPQAGRSRATSR